MELYHEAANYEIGLNIYLNVYNFFITTSNFDNIKFVMRNKL